MNNSVDFIPWLETIILQEVQAILKESKQNILQDFYLHRKSNNSTKKFHHITESYAKHHINVICHTLLDNTINLIHNQFNNQQSKFLIDIGQYPNNLITNDNTYPLLPQSALDISIYKENWVQLHKYKNLIFVDIETDGLNISTSNILQIALIQPHKQQNKNEFHYNIWSSYIKPNPNYTIDENGKAFKINKITQNMIDTAPTFNDVGIHIVDQTVGKTIVGYNIHSFDLPIIKNHLSKLGIKTSWAFSIDLAQVYWKHHPLTLENALKTYHIDPISAHNAIDDTKACISLMSRMINKNLLPDNHNELLNFIKDSKNRNERNNSHLININKNASHPWISNKIYSEIHNTFYAPPNETNNGTFKRAETSNDDKCYKKPKLVSS